MSELRSSYEIHGNKIGSKLWVKLEYSKIYVIVGWGGDGREGMVVGRKENYNWL